MNPAGRQAAAREPGRCGLHKTEHSCPGQGRPATPATAVAAVPTSGGIYPPFFFQLLFCPNISLLDAPYAKELNYNRQASPPLLKPHSGHVSPGSSLARPSVPQTSPSAPCPLSTRSRLCQASVRRGPDTDVAGLKPGAGGRGSITGFQGTWRSRGVASCTRAGLPGTESRGHCGPTG